ncbi:ParB N-terminal domain-containing protein [Rhodococcus hoagii]|nr:ParB N-terminal domain-containing protein [Prescottella equi]
MTNTESLELVTVDPTTLLVDTNIRADLRLTKGFLQSIAEHGVMTPPTAVRTADGQLRVRTGHRRTAAAVHNGLAAIPVLVIGDEATDDAATLDRLATQWAENEHRTGLDHADKVDTVEQMSLLGVPAGQIAKRLKTTRREVAAAVAVAQNDTARSHLAERDLTLDEAAAFAEFSDDPDAIASLEHAIDTGRLAHVAQSLRDRRAEHAAALEAGSAYAAEGITIYTEHPAYGTGPRALHSLVDADGNEATRETVPTEHLAAYMQGRVAYLDKETGDEIDEDTIDFTAAAPTTNPTKACATPTPSTSTTTATAPSGTAPTPLPPDSATATAAIPTPPQPTTATPARPTAPPNAAPSSTTTRHGPAPKPSAAHGSPTSPPARAPRRELPPSSPTHSPPAPDCSTPTTSTRPATRSSAPRTPPTSPH